MKKLTLFFAIISLFLFSCKKEVITPDPVVKTVYVHDTVIVIQGGDTIIVTIHDTVIVTNNPPALMGLWNLTKWTQQTNGGSITTNNTPGYTWTFTSSNVVENYGSSGTYTYPIVYNTGYVTVTKAGTPYDYSYSYYLSSQEYVLVNTKITGSNTVVSKYYLHQ